MSFNKSKFVIVASVILFCGLISMPEATAQQSTPTPLPESGVVIVSRADDFPTDTRIVTPNTNDEEMQSLEEKVDAFNLRMKELGKRINTIESSKETSYDLKQKRLLLNLDILSRAESRAQSLRTQLIDLVEKENEIEAKLEKIKYDLRPEMIDRMVAFAGTLRPEQLREMRRNSLTSEKSNLEGLLLQIQTNKIDLEDNVRKADLLVKKLRDRLEGEIDKALDDDEDL